MGIEEQIAAAEEELLALQKIPDGDKKFGDLKRELKLCQRTLELYDKLGTIEYSEQRQQLKNRLNASLKEILTLLQTYTNAYPQLEADLRRINRQATPEIETHIKQATIAEVGYSIKQAIDTSSAATSSLSEFDHLNFPEVAAAFAKAGVLSKLLPEFERHQKPFENALRNSPLRDKHHQSNVLSSANPFFRGMIEASFEPTLPSFCYGSKTKTCFSPSVFVKNLLDLFEILIEREKQIFDIENINPSDRPAIYGGALLAIYHQMSTAELCALHQNFRSKPFLNLMEAPDFYIKNIYSFIGKKLSDYLKDKLAEVISGRLNGLLQLLGATVSSVTVVLQQRDVKVEHIDSLTNRAVIHTRADVLPGTHGCMMELMKEQRDLLAERIRTGAEPYAPPARAIM